MDLGLTGGQEAEAQGGAYRVLARKYRPRDFSTLYGQEALVRTLTNAINSGRLAHAFMLTGVRGVGKTTTARIIARALNCSGDGNSGPTPEPCGTCQDCRAILADTHPDVLEMDAASNTSVDNIRELQESVAYRPALGRYKIYIIDEVHMLSSSAFNALLKTLEEPPEQVIFIFATTEIRKVPVTVLSRCQRFDLRRIGADVLVQLFTHIIGEEGLEAEAEALALIARAADGSARDGLSILDQAIALSGSPVRAAAVQDMLGLADRGRTLDLFREIQSGQVPQALALFDELYSSGAAPLQVMTELAELTHWMTRVKVAAGADDVGLPQALQDEGKTLAADLSLAHLSRTWQVLSKALGEIKAADHPKEAADMALIRLVYTANLPTPEDILKKLEGAPHKREQGARPTPDARGQAPERAPPLQAASIAAQSPSFDPLPGSSGADPNVRAIHAMDEEAAPRKIEGIPDIIAGLEAENMMMLAADMRAYARVISLRPGSLELAKHDRLAKSLPNTLSALLMKWTGQTWLVTLSQGDGGATLAQDEHDERQALKQSLLDHPLVATAKEAFPQARVINIQLDT